MLNLFQMPLHMTYISLINKLAYSHNIPPAMLVEGMLWFPDLSSPDPICILPILGGLVNVLNMLNTTTTNSNTVMRKMRKYILFMPLISIPIQMTFPVAFNLYWIASSSVQLSILLAFRTDSFRHFMGVPDHLPGSKLEKQHLGLKNRIGDNSGRPKVLKHKPKTLK